MYAQRDNGSEILMYILVVPLLLIFLVGGMIFVTGLPDDNVVESVAPIMYTDHAQTSHAEQLPDIDNCFKGNGTIGNWLRGANGRYMQVCSDGGPNNYMRVYECQGGELVVITQFKQAIKKLSNYLLNGGYEYTPPPPCQ